MTKRDELCPACNGLGIDRLDNSACDYCGGSGRNRESKPKPVARRDGNVKRYAELIERLEKLTGPSFTLACAIYEAFLPDVWFGSKVESWFGHGSGIYGCNTADGMRHLDCLRAPAITASMTAAMSFVPENVYWLLSKGRTKPDEPLYAMQILSVETNEVLAEDEHENLEICILLTALRARQAIEE